MDATKRFGLVRISTGRNIDILSIFSSDSNVIELLLTEIEKKHPVKKKNVFFMNTRIEFEKPKSGWNGPMYANWAAEGEAILLLLNSGWEPFGVFYNEHTYDHVFKKEY